MDRCILGSAIICFFCAGALLVVGFFEPTTPYWLTFIMCITAGGVALCFGSAVAICLSAIPHAKGVAAAGNLCLRLMIASACVWVGGLAYDGTLMPLVTLMFICQSTASILLVYAERKSDRKETVA